MQQKDLLLEFGMQDDNFDFDGEVQTTPNTFRKVFFDESPNAGEQMIWSNSDRGFVTLLKFNND